MLVIFFDSKILLGILTFLTLNFGYEIPQIFFLGFFVELLQNKNRDLHLLWLVLKYCIQAFPDQALTSPSGVQRRIYTPSAKREFDVMGGWDGVSNGSFNFLYTLWVYRTCIGLLIYILKICMGKCVFEKLENVLSPGGRLLCSLLRGPIVFNLGVIGVVKGVWGSKNTGDDRPF